MPEEGRPPVEETPAESPRLTDVPPLTYEMRQFEKASAGCDGAEGDGCARLTLSYPEITQAPTDAARSAIDRFVREAMLAPVSVQEDERATAPTPEALGESFLEEHRAHREQAPDAPAHWTIERVAEVVYETDELVTIKVTDGGYMGGAHPFTSVVYRTFDLDDGSQITPEDVFAPGFEEELRSRLEQGLRAAKAVPEGQSLHEFGFYFEGELPFPESFGVLEDTLVFWYDPYEIAPYVMGPVDVRIPREELSGLIDPRGALTDPAEG